MKGRPILLSIDPSLCALGFALYDQSFEARETDRYNIRSGAWRSGVVHPEGGSRIEKWRHAAETLCAEAADRRVTHLVIEWPIFFGGMRGKIAASRGDTLEIAGLAGYIAGHYHLRADHVTLYTPLEWKGAVPKRVTLAKFERLFGCDPKTVAPHYTDDIIDAIMIAEFWLRRHYPLTGATKAGERPREQQENGPRTWCRSAVWRRI
jgi:hypothetical protein